MEEFLKHCKEIILLDSTPENGTQDVAHFCAKLCRDSGLEVELQEGILLGKHQYNLIARPPQSNKKNEIIFQTHLDTVAPGPNALWTQTQNNPFNATIKDGKIFGLGTADVKLDFLCKLRALKEFKAEKMKNPFVLIGTFGEELGMEGAKLLMSSKKVNATKAIIGEPSELKIVYANNGYAVCRFEILFTSEEMEFRKNHSQGSATSQEKIFHGKAVHSSTPHLGENAILKLVEYIDKLPAGLGILEAHGGSVVNTVPAQAQIEIDAGFILNNKNVTSGIRLVKLVSELKRLEREFLNYENSEFAPPHPTLNIGVLKTTTQGLELSVSFRITPQVQKDQIDKWWAKLESFSKLNEIGFKLERMSSPAFTSPDSELVRGAVEIAKKLGLPEKPITKASGTECSVYVPFGIDCIVIGPGVSIGNSHTANEYNIIEQLEKAVEFYKEAVRKFCL